MSAPTVRTDFDALQKIATTFRKESDNIKQMLKRIKQAMSTLQGGDWVGEGANKFYAEMNDSVLPSLQRLAAALDEAGATTERIGRTMKQAEDEAARLFQDSKVGREAAGKGVAPAPSGGSAASPGGGTSTPMPPVFSPVERLPRPPVEASDNWDANVDGSGDSTSHSEEWKDVIVFKDGKPTVVRNPKYRKEQ